MLEGVVPSFIAELGSRPSKAEPDVFRAKGAGAVGAREAVFVVARPLKTCVAK